MSSKRNSKFLTQSTDELHICANPGNYQSRPCFDSLNTIDTDMLKKQLMGLPFWETLCYRIINKPPYFYKECCPEDDISQYIDANQSNY